VGNAPPEPQARFHSIADFESDLVSFILDCRPPVRTGAEDEKPSASANRATQEDISTVYSGADALVRARPPGRASRTLDFTVLSVIIHL
jgi:hypothetical protein